MILSFKKNILTAAAFLVGISSFAFPADPDPTVDPPAPIDAALLILLVAGIGLGCYYFWKKYRKATV